MVNMGIIERIEALPPLPKSIKEIEEAYKDPNISAKEVAEIVEKDPLVVADLLRVVNSPASGLRREVTSVEQAVCLIGLKAVKDLVISISLRNLFKIDLSPYGTNSEKFARASYFQNFLAQYLIREISPKKVDSIRLQALLQELGKIVIAEEIIFQNEDEVFKIELDVGLDIRELERNYVDITTAQVTAQMLEYWGFEQTFVDGIRWSDEPNQATIEQKDEALILRIVSEIANVHKPFSEESRQRALPFVKKANISLEVFDYFFNDFKELWNL